MKRYAQRMILALACLMAAAGMAFAENDRDQGSTTVLPIAQAALEAYMKANPGAKISLSGGGRARGSRR